MTELTQIIEAVLFAAPEPLTIAALAEACDSTPEAVTAALAELKDTLLSTGLRLSEHNNSFRLVSSPDATAAIAKYHNQTIKHDLTRAALETLAIIAYQGPLSRQAIEDIRGVGSDQMIKNLMQRGLIEENGRAKEPGRPALYAVTHLFLETVGVATLNDLPPLPQESGHP